MQKLLGEQLVEKKLLTEKELHMAVERQRLQGGRIGDNLVALGLISEEELSTFFKRTPQPPKTVEDTGLEISFIADLIMKHVLFMGEFTLAEVADKVKLPVSVVDKAVDVLRKEHLLEAKGAAQFTKAAYKFAITDQGKNRATDLLEVCRYVGPTPVPFDEYRAMVAVQTVKSIIVSEESVTESFSHLIVGEGLLKRLGPAVSSGKAIFLYGPPGNGKTSIAETIGKVLPGNIYMPHAVLVGGEIITVYDPVNNVAVEPELSADAVDQRWVQVQRPVVMAGGELTLKTLDLDFNPVTKFYEAPLQMKANNGLFIVDDFGRQQMDPQNLLNRWIVPLERRIDLLTLHTGMKFEIPFDQLVVFSTNIEPKNLVDEAFLRRIRYKIKIDHPMQDEYERIFVKMCESNGITFKKDMFEYLMDNYYRRLDVRLNACHPRDIIDQIIDNAIYHRHAPELTKETISAAWENYFVEL
jgi:predicted ATPase with chaperone activity